jgi:hypothetical protein
MTDRESHCYRVKLPTNTEARRTLGMESLPLVRPDAADERLIGILCGALGPPCFHCGGVSEALCDFPIGDESRTCDRALCLECAPTVDADKNYCHDHDEHGRKILLFPQPKRVLTPPGPPPRKRARPLPKAPPASHRWRVRQGRGDPRSHGAVLTSWMPELDARRFAAKVGGYVETWDQFVTLWRTLYPLAPKKPRGGR